MTLMKNGEIIALVRRKKNLFMLNLVYYGKAIATISQKAMAITRRGQPTHLVSQNKCIRLWHQRLAYVSNASIIRGARLVDSINLDIKDKRFDPANMTINSDNSDKSDFDTDSNIHIDNLSNIQPVREVAHKIKTDKNNDLLDKLCISCVGSKSTWVVRQYKLMTPTSNKLEEVHVDLWGSYDPPSQSRSIYLIIFMCKHLQKT